MIIIMLVEVLIKRKKNLSYDFCMHMYVLPPPAKKCKIAVPLGRKFLFKYLYDTHEGKEILWKIKLLDLRWTETDTHRHALASFTGGRTAKQHTHTHTHTSMYTHTYTHTTYWE